MIPQNSENNRGLHSNIETAVRNLTGKYAKLYVITGPVFSSQNLTWMHSRVAVPNKIFKLVYDPVSGRASAYLEDIAPGDLYKVVSIKEIDALTSIDLLPGVKVSGALDLPPPVRTDSKFSRTPFHPTSIFARTKHIFGVRF